MMYELIRCFEGDPRIIVLRQELNTGKIDLNYFAFRLREIKESYDV